MKAAVYYENGGPEVLKYEDIPDPICPTNGVLVRVRAISIEGGDTTNRGKGAMASIPHVVGYQAAGEIVEVGSEVSGFTVGQRVTTTGAYGSHAELRVTQPVRTFPVPDGMDLELASTLPIPFGTAENCLFEYGKLKPGGTALLQSAAGAVGIAAIQIAKRAGARVIATASSDQRLSAIEHFGVDHSINSSNSDISAEVMKYTEGKGVDVVIDENGGRSLQSSIASLGWKGIVTLIGRSGRDSPMIDPFSLIGGNRSLVGVGLGTEAHTPRVRKMIERLIFDVARGELTMPIDKRFHLSEVAEAHAYIESRKAVGRVLLLT